MNSDYKSWLLENNDFLSHLSHHDSVLYMYLKDHRYSKGLRKVLKEDEVNLKSQDLIKQVIVKIIKFTNTYDKQIVLDIRNSVWL